VLLSSCLYSSCVIQWRQIVAAGPRPGMAWHPPSLSLTLFWGTYASSDVSWGLAESPPDSLATQGPHRSTRPPRDPQGPHRSTRLPRATTFQDPPRHQATARWAGSRGVQHAVARGGVGGGWALAGARRGTTPRLPEREAPPAEELRALAGKGAMQKSHRNVE